MKILKPEISRVRSLINAIHICLIGTLGDRYMPIMVICGTVVTLMIVISTPPVLLQTGYPGRKGILLYTAVPL